MTYEILREIDVLDVRTPVEDLQITFQNEDIQVPQQRWWSIPIGAAKVSQPGSNAVRRIDYADSRLHLLFRRRRMPMGPERPLGRRT